MSKMFVACHSWSHVVSQPFSALSFDLFCWICSILLVLTCFKSVCEIFLVHLAVSRPGDWCLAANQLLWEPSKREMSGLPGLKWWVSSHGFPGDSRSRWMWCKWTRPRLSGLALASRQVWAWNEKPEMLFRAWSGLNNWWYAFINNRSIDIPCTPMCHLS